MTLFTHHYPAGCNADVVSGEPEPAALRWEDLGDADVDGVLDSFVDGYGRDYAASLQEALMLPRDRQAAATYVEQWRRHRDARLVRLNNAR